MRFRKPTGLLAGLFLLLSLAPLATAAERVPVPDGFPGLTVFKLDNGLELFVLENPAVPLARIQVTFRCGAITQSADSAGLFHLYEHMLFKGNVAYPSESAFAAAMTSLGVATWNGGTSSEYVTYYFTVPADLTEKGMEFWSNAVRYPLLREDELETEKNVVINEIRGYFDDPDRVYQAAIDRELFYRYPWRRDVSGSEAAVRGATVDDMRRIKDEYYAADNAALFVGGAVDADEVLAWAERWFGDWQSAAARPERTEGRHPAPQKESRIAYADPSMYGGFGAFSLRFRGPDVDQDPGATYAADVWGYLVDNPEGRFKSDIFAAVPGLYRKDYISAYYYTQRDGGQIDFGTYYVADPGKPVVERALEFELAVKDECAAIADTTDYFSDSEFRIVKTILADQRDFEMETPSGFLSLLSFWWASAGTDYFFSYVPSMRKVTPQDIQAYLKTYVVGAAPVLALRANADDFAAERGSLAGSGFREATKDNAFWWNKGGAQ